MKKWGSIWIAFVMMITLLSPTAAYGETKSDETDDTFKAMWVATVLNLDYPSKPTTNEQQLKSEAIEAIQYAKETGLNAIILQVRPSGDAFYNSKYFPWSKYLTGEQGLAPDNQFDPLTFWVEEAHKNGIELHAWINPFRVTRKGAKEPAHDFSALSANHPARLHNDWVVKHTDGGLYFNPGVPAVRTYLLESIEEILVQYDVDGIHFDDYFYPGAKFDDSDAYRKYNPKNLSLEDWRRDNVNQLVEDTHNLVKQYSKDVAFGVSPFAVWQNKSSDVQGSDTRALESYSDHFADTKRWVEKEWVDYIAPQIYWEIGYKIADYSIVLNWWKDLVEDTDVKLYVGHAAYRLNDKNSKSAWYGNDEIFRQLSLNRSLDVDGSIFFRYKFMKANRDFTNRLSAYYDGTQDTSSINPGHLVVARPSKSKVQTTAASYYIGGASNPNEPLYINGTLITDRTSHGYFGYFYKLKTGNNKIVVKNGSQVVEKFIVKGKSTNSNGNSGTSSGGTTTPTTTAPGNSSNASNTKKEMLLAIVNKPTSNVYYEPSTVNGGAMFLDSGMKDTVLATYKNFYKLKNGLWINKNDVTIVKNQAFVPILSKVTHTSYPSRDVITVNTKDAPFIRMSTREDDLSLKFSGVLRVPDFVVDPAGVFESYIKQNDGYVLTFKENENIQGYDYKLTSTGYEITVYKQFQAKSGSKPLEGATIVVDPGHGGSDTGTLGLLGTQYAEKDLVLSLGLALRNELEALGANVVMTRDKDVAVSLQERVDKSKSVSPNLFVSIHADNASDTIDLSKVEGFSVFYRNDYSKPLAQWIQSTTLEDFYRKNRNIKNMNFYVIRGSWSPSVLIETGFMSHPSEFQWLTDKSQHSALAKSWANAMVDFFGGYQK